MCRAPRVPVFAALVVVGLHCLGCRAVDPTKPGKEVISDIAATDITVADFPIEDVAGTTAAGDFTATIPTITSNRDFAVDLYQQLAKENKGQNLFFSPYSMFSALAIAVEGAQGETAIQMGNVLRFAETVRQVGDNAEMIPWNTDLIHSDMSALNQRFSPKPVPQKLRDHIAALRKNLDAANRQATELQNAGKYREASQASERGKKLAAQLNSILVRVDKYELRVANALWSDKAYSLAPSYLEKIHKFYGAGAVFPVDFKNHTEAARQQINAWVEDQTNKRIRDLIPSGGVNRLTRLILTNAIYFKGEWQEPFLEKSTKQDDFTIAGGTKVPVPMMNQRHKHDVNYAAFNADGTFFTTPKEVPFGQDPDPKTVYPDKDGFLMLELPYKGGDLSMVAILPQDADGLEDFEKKLSGDALQNWIGKLQVRVVHVHLPKFKLETEYGMNQALAAMGMSRAFEIPVDSSHGAQFERMSASQDPVQQFYITEVRHKAFVEVSEKGTEAAAATALLMEVSARPVEVVMVPFIPTFRADQPFLFLIRDMKTGTILFLGRMVHPQE